MAVFRELFGPSKKEIWTKLSNEIDAKYVEGSFFRNDKVEAKVGEWTITLDTQTVSTGKVTVTYTRIRAPYVNRDGLRFTVYKAGLFSALGKFLGGQDIEVGYEEFDNNFVIKGNNEDKIRALFSNGTIRELMLRQPDFHMEVKDDEGWFGSEFPDGVDELCFQVNGVIMNIDLLKDLFELFSETLNYLCIIGSAYEEDPKVTLK